MEMPQDLGIANMGPIIVVVIRCCCCCYCIVVMSRLVWNATTWLSQDTVSQGSAISVNEFDIGSDSSKSFTYLYICRCCSSWSLWLLSHHYSDIPATARQWISADGNRHQWIFTTACRGHVQRRSIDIPQLVKLWHLTVCLPFLFSFACLIFALVPTACCCWPVSVTQRILPFITSLWLTMPEK